MEKKQIAIVVVYLCEQLLKKICLFKDKESTQNMLRSGEPNVTLDNDAFENTLPYEAFE